MATKKNLIRLDVYVKRHPSLTSEEFHHKWSNEHAPMINEWLQRHGILTYTQVHMVPGLQEQLLGQKPEGPFADFDGHGECVMEDISALKALVEDPYYKEVVRPAEEKLIDIPKSVQYVAYEEVYIRDGKIIR